MMVYDAIAFGVLLILVGYAPANWLLGKMIDRFFARWGRVDGKPKA